MSESENVEFMKRVYALLEQDDITEFIDEACAQDAEWIYPEVREIPYCRSWRGATNVARFFAVHDQEEEILDFRQHHFIAQGSRVVALGSFRGRVRSTGRIWDTNFVHVATIANGKLAKFEAYFDTAAAAKARLGQDPGMNH